MQLIVKRLLNSKNLVFLPECVTKQTFSINIIVENSYLEHWVLKLAHFQFAVELATVVAGDCSPR